MTQIPFAEHEVAGTIHARFERVAASVPDQIAITSGQRSISYDALNRAANRLAHALLAGAARPGWPIPILFDHDIEVIIALLAVLKAGRACVVLDPQQPATRLANIVKQLETEVLVSDGKHARLAQELAGKVDGLAIVNRDVDALGQPDSNPGIYSDSDSLAVITFTSGSTGEPKGVTRNHWPILHRQWANVTRQPHAIDDRIAMLYGCQFGAAYGDLFGALLTGCTLCLYDFRTQGLHGLTPWLHEQAITYLHIPVDLFRPWLDGLNKDEHFPRLRQIAPAGRQYWRDIAQARQHVPHACTFVSRFSSNETMMVACLPIDAETPLGEGVVPVGYPAPGCEITILNEQGEAAADGEVGEAIVRSRQITSGYWRQPDLTAQTIWQDADEPDVRVCRNGDYLLRRSDGCLEFHGRRDDRVKVRGYTVELGEVEAALLRLAAVKAGAVLAHEVGSGDKHLAAYVVPADPAHFDAIVLRQALAEILPAYMIPAFIVPLPALPLTANAKIDRQALAALSLADASIRPVTPYRAPETTVEAMLAGIWADVLEMERIGIDDNFLELGGNSILAARVLARINASLDVEISFSVLMDAATIAALAAAIDEQTTLNLNEFDLTALLDEIEAEA